MMTPANTPEGGVVYSRTTILPDGSQQVEHFHLSPVAAAFVNGVLGEPDTIALIDKDQAQRAADAMGTYAQISMED